MSYVYTPKEADVPKPSRVHIWVGLGCVRPKINDAAVVYVTSTNYYDTKKTVL
jgi:hypothetical protein